MSRGRPRVSPGLFSVAAAVIVVLLTVTSRDAPAAGRPGFGVSASASGRLVAFDSDSAALVRGDTNGTSDVFVRDRLAGTTERVSVGGRSGQGNGHSSSPSVSADGRFVAFASAATNLVAGDANGEADVFVRDRASGATELVSLAVNGEQGNRGSGGASLSADGRFVAFDSYAWSLAPGDVNGEQDVFLRDRASDATELISVGSDGQRGDGFSYLPAVSGDGRFVAFSSYASNLVAGDRNRITDVFVRDRAAGTTVAISVAGDGETGNGLSDGASISADGRFVAFSSSASDLVAGDTNRFADVFLRDRLTGVTERVSVAIGETGANGSSGSAAVSADGRFVAFASAASNLVTGDTNESPDVFVRDRTTGTTRRVSVSSGGTEADDDTGFNVSISFSGRVVVFESQASNLVPGREYYDDWEVYAHDLVGGATEQVSVATTRAVPGKIRVAPPAPRAGRRMTVSVPITQGGRPVVAAIVSCAARVGTRRLAAVSAYGGGVARCTWSLPQWTAGKVVRGFLAAETPNGAVRRPFEVRVR